MGAAAPVGRTEANFASKWQERRQKWPRFPGRESGQNEVSSPDIILTMV